MDPTTTIVDHSPELFEDIVRRLGLDPATTSRVSVCGVRLAPDAADCHCEICTSPTAEERHALDSLVGAPVMTPRRARIAVRAAWATSGATGARRVVDRLVRTGDYLPAAEEYARLLDGAA